MSPFDTMRSATRGLLRTPGFTLAVALVLGVGVGAGTTVFSAVDAILFRSLPVREPARLVRLRPDPPGNWSYPAFLDYAEPSGAFSGVAAYTSAGVVHLSDDGRAPERVEASLVSEAFFDVVGVRPALGRGLAREESHVAVLSDACFRRRFNGEPAVVGRAVRVNGQAFTIVGVAPPGFRGADLDTLPDMWVPASSWKAILPMFADEDILSNRGFSFIEVVARLADGMTLAGAQARVDAIAARPRPEIKPDERTPRAVLLTTREAILWEKGAATRLSWTLLFAAFLVLLLSAAVVAGLFLVRSERRRAETAVRLALGGSRADLVLSALGECVLVSALAAGAGLLAASWAGRLIAALSPEGLPIPLDAATEAAATRVILFAAGTALLTGLLASLPAALRASAAADLVTSLKSDARTSARGRRGTLGGAFVAVAVALSVVLLVGAGLLVRTLSSARSVDPGFRVDGAVTVSLEVSRQGYSREAGVRFFERLLERVRALSGVEAAGLARAVPVQAGGMRATVVVVGYSATDGKDPNVDYNPVSPGFFAALGLPLLEGRDFSERDVKGAPSVVIVNKAFADRFFPGRSPVGQRLTELAMDKSGLEIVGVAGTAKLRSLREDPVPAVYVPHAQGYLPGMSLVARSRAGDGRALLPAIREAVADLDRDLPVHGAQTLREHMGQTLARETLLASLLTGFGVMSLLLAAFGLFCVLAYAAEVRRREIGIRMALGAEAGDILKLVLSQAARVTVAGLLGGTLASLFLTRLVRHLLFRVSPADPATFAAVAAVLSVSALLAAYLPARRATRVDPIQALRAD